jgi:hypothetical protein
MLGPFTFALSAAHPFFFWYVYRQTHFGVEPQFHTATQESGL